MARDSNIVKALKEALEDVQGKTNLKERSVDIEDIDVHQIFQKYIKIQ